MDRKLLVIVACECVEAALVHVSAAEEGPRRAIETAKAWTAEKTTLDDVYVSADAAATVNAAYAASSAAHAVVNAAVNAAHAAVYAPVNAAHAAANAAHAAARAGGEAAKVASLAHSADLVRTRIPWSVVADKLTLSINNAP